VFCPNCGTKNDDTATTCTKCGFKLGGPAGAKFRGTMMLNSEQSVQGMLDEHRRKLQEASAARESAEGPEGASPAPPEAVFKAAQPVGTGAPKRRMGTMLGVAPQGGGLQPPNFYGAPTPPLPSAVAPVPDGADAASAPDPLGGTLAFAVPPATATPAPSPAGTPASPLAPGRTEAFAAPAVAPAAVAAGRTEAFAAAPEPIPGPLAAQRGRTEAFDATPPPIEQPSIEQPSIELAPAPRPSAESYTPAGVPRRLKPLDVFLIVITLGLYALVLRARHRSAT